MATQLLQGFKRLTREFGGLQARVGAMEGCVQMQDVPFLPVDGDKPIPPSASSSSSPKCSKKLPIKCNRPLPPFPTDEAPPPEEQVTQTTQVTRHASAQVNRPVPPQKKIDCKGKRERRIEISDNVISCQ